MRVPPSSPSATRTPASSPCARRSPSSLTAACRPSSRTCPAIDKTDFLYTCPSHLADRNFASSLAPPSPGPAAGPSKEEIGKVIAEYEAKERKRKAAGEKDGKAEDDDGAADDDKCKDKGSSKDAAAGASPAYLTPSAPPTPTHNVFALHRDFFAMRLAEQRKRDNLVKVRRGRGARDAPRV